MQLPRTNGHSHGRLPRNLTQGVLITLLLSVIGLFAYISLPITACSPTSQYVHSAVQGATSKAADAVTAAASTAAAAVKGALPGAASSSDSSSTSGSSQPLISGLLQHDAPASTLIDAAVQAGTSNSDLRQLMQLQQHAFCLGGRHKAPLPGSAGVPFGNITMFVYGSNDIVSNELKGLGRWEKPEIDEWWWAIREWKPKQAAAGSTSSVPERPLAVDIGANLGWFAINAAAAGARVAAFEAMPANIALIRRSLCSSPWLAEQTALYATGLGEESGECYIISDTKNKGDGIVYCDKEKAYNTKGYEVHGVIPLRRLDTLLQEEVQVLKIDVEGFEQKVLTGAKDLLTKHKVHHIMAECNTGIIGEEGGKRFIQFLHDYGYEISPMGFRGPFWDAKQIPDARCSNINLYAKLRAA